MTAALVTTAGMGAPQASTSGHRTYPVEEWGFVEVPTGDLLQGERLSVYPSVIDGGYFTLRPRHGSLMLQACGYIGIIPLSERVTIEVTPRVPLSNLSRVLRIAEHAPEAIENTARLYEREPDMYPSLVDLYAQTLAGYVNDIAAHGLLREYEQRQEVTSFPRGRILISETISSLRPKGIRHRLATSWFQRNVDNSSNRCIKYAIWFLARHRRDVLGDEYTKQARLIRQALNRAYRVFDGVELDLQRGFMSDSTVLGRRPMPAVRAYYRPTVDLCLAIIRQQAVSLDRETGDLGLPSLIVDMSAAFEHYLRNVLSNAAAEEQWPVEVLDGNRGAPSGGAKALFHTGADTMATPDVVVASDAGTERTYPLIVEVKYKPSDRSLSRDDLNQAISYGASYRCPHVVLVRPRGSFADSTTIGMRQLGTVEHVSLHQYVYDLGADDVVAEEGAFCAQMRTLAGVA